MQQKVSFLNAISSIGELKKRAEAKEKRVGQPCLRWLQSQSYAVCFSERIKLFFGDQSLD